MIYFALLTAYAVLLKYNEYRGWCELEEYFLSLTPYFTLA